MTFVFPEYDYAVDFSESIHFNSTIDCRAHMVRVYSDNPIDPQAMRSKAREFYGVEVRRES